MIAVQVMGPQDSPLRVSRRAAPGLANRTARRPSEDLGGGMPPRAPRARRRYSRSAQAG